MIKKIVGVGIIILLLVGIFYYRDVYRTKPRLNLGATETLTITGHLDKGVSLTMYSSTYMGLNESCDITTNLLEGATAPRTISFNYVVSRNGNSSYETSIPINKIQPGYCQWALVDISYLLVKNNKGKQDLSHSLLRFNNNAKRTNNAKLTIQCQRDPGFDYLDGYDCSLPDGNIDAFQLSPRQKSIVVNFVKHRAKKD